MKNNKALLGVGTFLFVNLAIALFCFLSDLKLTGDGIIGTNPVAKVMFSVLFILAFFAFSFIYGHQRNTEGLLGLIAVFLIPFIGLLGGISYL